jgi:hypothetical protein
MDEVTQERAHRSWRIAERVKRLSDGLVRIGPWGLGVDAVIDWLPGGGPVYSAGAGALLIYEAIAAGASKATIARMTAYLLLDTGVSSVPLIGWAADALFTGHALAARATAGGFTYRANTHKVFIKRADVDKEQQYRLTDTTPVAPGDTIRIVERLF